MQLKSRTDVRRACNHRLQSMWERHYAEAFGPTETALPFLNYYTVTPEKTLACETFTRGEFLALATRAKGVLAARGVAAGDRVAAEQSLITLESDKATMEIPSPSAGVVRALHVAVGDKVSEGSSIATLEVAEADTGAPEPLPASAEARSSEETAEAQQQAEPAAE